MYGGVDLIAIVPGRTARQDAPGRIARKHADQVLAVHVTTKHECQHFISVLDILGWSNHELVVATVWAGSPESFDLRFHFVSMLYA